MKIVQFLFDYIKYIIGINAKMPTIVELAFLIFEGEIYFFTSS